MEQRWVARLPMGLFTLNVQTGETKTIHKTNDWLNHLLFSPTDPTLLMFCHEGPWHKVERIWTIRADGTQLKKIHTRTVAMEIFGHEFWSGDGGDPGQVARARGPVDLPVPPGAHPQWR